MTEDEKRIIRQIAERWRKFGLEKIHETSDGQIIIDDNRQLGPYYFGLIGEIEQKFGRKVKFAEMDDLLASRIIWSAP